MAALISGSKRRFQSLGIQSTKGRTTFVLRVNTSKVRIVAAQLKDAYPGSQIDIRETAQYDMWYVAPIRISPDNQLLKTHSQFIEEHSRVLVDPIQPVLELLTTGKSGRTEFVLWIHFREAKPRRIARSRRQLPVIAGRFRFMHARRIFERSCASVGLCQRTVSFLAALACRREEKLIRAEKLESVLAECSFELQVGLNKPNKSLVKSKQADIVAAFSLFAKSGQQVVACKPRKVRKRPARPKSKNLFLLSPKELATLWHAPTNQTSVPRIDKANFHELEPPKNLASRSGKHNSVVLGRVCYRSEKYHFEMELDARRRHLYIIGKTGMGKTTLLQNIITDDINKGHGVAVLDPHGDLADTTLRQIPKGRTNDVVLIDPSDPAYAISFNPLQVPNGADKSLVADGVLSAFQKVFGFDESQAPRMMHIFRNCLLSLVELPESSLLDVQRILNDTSFRKTVITHVSNPIVKEFWIGEYGQWAPKDRTAIIASLQNKLGAFTTNEKLQQILSQRKGRLDLRRIIDEKKILIANLSKGRVGENVSSLLGSLLVTCLQQAAMSRADVTEEERTDYSIIIDEFQNYATPSVAVFLSEARKYRTHLILSHQYTSQLPVEILDAVLGNVGSLLTFQIGVDDAELFAKQLGGMISPNDLVALPKFHAYCRMLIDGMPSLPFSLTTTKPKQNQLSRSAIVRKVSNQYWATPLSRIPIANS